MDKLTYEELHDIKFSHCEACKGCFYMEEAGCYKTCNGFKEELKELRKEK